MTPGLVPRIQRTLLTTVAIFVAYYAYSEGTRQLLTPTTQSVRRIRQPEQNTAGSEVFQEQAEKWFPHASWVQHADGRFRDDQWMLYFQDHELINDNRSIRVSPLAVLRSSDNDSSGVTMTAEAAQLDASTPFSLGRGQFGRITSGVLSGRVRIDASDGMRIEGRTFRISEDATRIWTNEPVQFWWDDPAGESQGTGVADGGAEIEFGSDAEGNGIADSSDHKIRLLGRVHCDLSLQDGDPSEEPIELTIKAANGFEYFDHKATFFGFVDRELRPELQIDVQGNLPDIEGVHRLLCSRLTLQMLPGVVSDGSGHRRSALEIDSITASGRIVLYRLATQQLTAEMTQLRYRLQDRVLELQGRARTDVHEALPVDVRVADRRLVVPFISVTLDEESQPRWIECIGEGSLQQQSAAAETGGVQGSSLQANWQEAFTLERADGQDKLTLSGGASVNVPEQQLLLSARELRLTLDQGESAAPSADSVSRLPGGGQLRELQADENVQIDSPQLRGTAERSLSLTFADAASESADDSGRAGPAGDITSAVGGSGNGAAEFSCRTITARLRRDASGRQQLDDLWLRGSVSASHLSAERSGGFTARGNAMHVRTVADGGRRISLYGDPAAVIRDSDRIEGARIELRDPVPGNAQQRTAEVNGSGRIRFVLNSKSMNRAAPLDIYWNEQMTYAGNVVQVHGNVRAVLNNEVDFDGEFSCVGMTVTLASDVTREPPRAGVRVVADEVAAGVQIERIQCSGRVVIDADVMTDGEITGHHHAEFSDLEFNQLTGDFQALGPGRIESVQPDESENSIASRRPLARANTAVQELDRSCIFMRATFEGSIEGNQHSQFVRLKYHVRGEFGPVRSLNDQLQLEHLTMGELPDNAGTLGCENLTVSRLPQPDGSGSFLTLVAESNTSNGAGGTRSPCRLESRLFSGVADKITIDHSKKQYILRAEEGRKARVSYLPDGGQLQTLVGRRFVYYSRRNELSAEQIFGVQAAGGL